MSEECIVFDKRPVKLESSGKYLGMYIDEKMNFSNHIEYVCSKVSRSIGILYRIRLLVPRRVLVNLYYCLIYPYLTYCNIIWGGTARIHLLKLEILQKKIVRIMTISAYLAHTDPLFNDLNIMKLKDIHNYILCQLMYKRNIMGSLLVENHCHDTRRGSDVRPVFRRLNSTQQCSEMGTRYLFNDFANFDSI